MGEAGGDGGAGGGGVDEVEPPEPEEPEVVEEYPVVEFSERLMRVVEVVAAYVLVFLFAVGVFDLGLRIGDAVVAAFRPDTGSDITDPEVVVGFIDTALLLFIIVEIYQTVVAYTRASGTQQIVRLVIYAGIIAMVRKAIIFRTDTYPTVVDALTAAASYTAILLGLGVVLFVTYRFGPDPAESS
ncbi:MAG: phosphate-starvation-inducible PsiE family protein [Halobacteriaceae archaeon]